MLRILGLIGFGIMICSGDPVLANSRSEACRTAPEPVVSLNIGSIYADESVSRSKIDGAKNAAVMAAIAPIEGFLRSLARLANDVTEGGGERNQKADCVIEQLWVWANADALSDLGTRIANYAVSKRLAGFAFVYRQVAPYASDIQNRTIIEDWLGRRAQEQMVFWEKDAASGSKKGNLRAWATLAINLIGEIRNDPHALRLSARSASQLQCLAEPDGSLPQEMLRGKYALHYQLHAIAPLVIVTLLLEKQGLSIRGICDKALDRIVQFAIDDLETGEASMEYSGKTQSYFDGTETLEGHELAWLEAYLILSPNPRLERVADAFRPLEHSKLGGSQALMWSDYR